NERPAGGLAGELRTGTAPASGDAQRPAQPQPFQRGGGDGVRGVAAAGLRRCRLSLAYACATETKFACARLSLKLSLRGCICLLTGPIRAGQATQTPFFFARLARASFCLSPDVMSSPGVLSSRA